MAVFDVCIIGAGMTGSAAARWVTELRPDIRVCLVGPSEPTEDEWNDVDKNRTVFGSHYDEARIVSEMCSRRRDDTWPTLVRRSIDRYRDLENRSGVKFYNEVGCIFKAFKKDISKFHETLPAISKTTIERFTADELNKRFSFLHANDDNGSDDAEDDFHSLYESVNAGYINPRKYILANQTIAAQKGCELIDAVVRSIIDNERQVHPLVGRDNERTTVTDDFVKSDDDSICNNGQNTLLRLTTKSKHRGRHDDEIILARKVLVCAGGFVNDIDIERLISDPRVEFNIDVMTEMAVMIELSEDDAKRLSGIPPVLVFVADDDDPRNAYILPPIRYPNGKMYLKVGHDKDLNRPLRSQPEVTSWYREKGKGKFEDFKSIYLRVYQTVTGFRPKSLHAVTCVTTYTPTGQFYCDLVTPQLGLVTGGNGGGAMAADEIGRMGAHLIVNGSWGSDLPREEFAIRWRNRTDIGVKSSL